MRWNFSDISTTGRTAASGADLPPLFGVRKPKFSSSASIFRRTEDDRGGVMNIKKLDNLSGHHILKFQTCRFYAVGTKGRAASVIADRQPKGFVQNPFMGQRTHSLAIRIQNFRSLRHSYKKWQLLEEVASIFAKFVRGTPFDFRRPYSISINLTILPKIIKIWLN